MPEDLPSWPESASKLYRPSDRFMSEKWVPTFADRGCHVVSVTDPPRPYSRLCRPRCQTKIFKWNFHPLTSIRVWNVILRSQITIKTHIICYSIGGFSSPVLFPAVWYIHVGCAQFWTRWKHLSYATNSFGLIFRGQSNIRPPPPLFKWALP
jgi:hypothetical protein